MSREGRTAESHRETARRAGEWIGTRIGHVLDELEAGRDTDPRTGEHRLAVLLGAWRSARALQWGGRRRIDPPASGSDPRAAWRNRLVSDPKISEASPVVRGTGVTVAQVVSLVIDGWSWDRIQRAYPELTTDDIRACLSYSVENNP